MILEYETVDTLCKGYEERIKILFLKMNEIRSRNQGLIEENANLKEQIKKLQPSQ